MSFLRLCAVWLCVALLPTAARATATTSAAATPNDPGTSRCGWGPVTDVEAVRSLLREWVASTNLPPFDAKRWNASIDHSSVWVQLQFAEGELEVAWEIDDDCEPTAIAIQTSPSYQGTRPDEDAIRQLVERFRSVTIEKRLEVPFWTYPELRRVVFSRGLAIPLVLAAALSWLLLWLWRRWSAAGRVTLSNAIRLFGLIAVIALLPFESPRFVHAGPGDWLYANSMALIGILPLMAFLWLVLSGAFGYGSPRREDWPALLIFLLALAIRLGYARHGIEELEIYFYYGGFPNRHSVVHALYQMFMQSLAGDPYRFMMNVNGTVGALATLPLFLLVRQRTGSQMAAGLVSALYAVHPILVQMAPTDGHYALVLSTWFAGLALLTADEVDAPQLFGGAVLLGIAATSRAEGSLYLVASLLLVDVRKLLVAAWRHLGTAAAAAFVVLGLIGIHMYFVFPAHVGPEKSVFGVIGQVTLNNVLRAGLFSEDFNDPLFVKLVLVGALAGLVNKRLRIGLGAAVGTLVVVWPMSMATTEGFTVLHRLVPVCALQVIAAGVGAAWITSFLPSRVRHHWVAAIPGVVLVLFLFVTHRHEMRAPNAVTDEFWMLRNHLAPEGSVDPDCTLLFVGSTMDTDIHDFGQVLPGMRMARCENEDCVRIASEGGCFYYLRSLNCFFSESEIPAACFERGRTPAGDLFACLRPRCVDIEKALELAPIEERTVDLWSAFRGDPRWPRFQPRWPRKVDIGLYEVLGVREPAKR